MNSENKTVFYVVLVLVLLLFWMKTDPGSESEDDDPDIVSIDYRCSLLNQYKYVPDEVVTECASRMNEIESKKKPTKPTKQNISNTV
jgi:hypothetical protein